MNEREAEGGSPAGYPAYGVVRRVGATLWLRCPRCCRGRVWAAPFRMFERCPVCGLWFEREPGYFTGAMYASYFIGLFVSLPVWLWMLLAGAPFGAIVAVAAGLVVSLTPVAFHYSRVAWMQVDAFFNPRTFAEDVPA
ncbi:S1C family serine protease [Tepidiforma sp.]|uniref:S1C family serine protease n=1 Tax=Tepidiforma sp. TaxID=2682230 RepID=UPI002ADDA56F|nr:S1C family serine protease [Tepidiforma sp.]